MGRRYSSTLDPLILWSQCIFSSATHHFIASSSAFQSPSLAPSLLLFPPHPGTQQTLCDEITAEWGGYRVTLHSPGFPRPCKQDCAEPTHPTNKGLTAAPSTRALTGQGSSPPELQWCLRAHPQRIHFYWDIFPVLGSWHSYCYTDYFTNPRGNCGLSLLSPMHDCTTARQRELHSPVNPSGCISLSTLLIFKQYQGASNTTAFESLKSSSIF